MHGTADVLQQMASVISLHGVHTGDQFAIRTHQDRLTQHDICALAWVVAEGRIAPREFFIDEVTSLAIIGASAPAMAAIRAISEALDTPTCETEIAPGLYAPDYIEHVSNWAATPPIFATDPPTVDEVIGRILRAHNTLTTQSAA
ncbi:hypothetical protein P1P75_40315 [Streptomyces sp. ID05-39B]|uniref:hypothetical protein n=1 Tax=Streptomyces sp. ID05-39B TaxID=3028664 RepID=UPI0029B318E3|nr:hypothetical protein [Streptomyces sp. ID05-39B]MDX3532476.1 hypothetical protein [Streptomyces sp. ID05-39B]